MSFVKFTGWSLAVMMLGVALVISVPLRLTAQGDYRMNGGPIAPAPADPAISAALNQIDEARVRKTIETLVAFGTRSTISSMETDLPPGTGVTAAADWIFGQFEAISKDCGGCLEVKRDTFTNPVAERIPKPTTITNVYAVLKGADPVLGSACTWSPAITILATLTRWTITARHREQTMMPRA